VITTLILLGVARADPAASITTLWDDPAPPALLIERGLLEEAGAVEWQ